MSASVIAMRNRYCATVRGGNPEKIVAARQALTATVLERAITNAHASPHGLRFEDRQRLAAMLLDGGPE